MTSHDHHGTQRHTRRDCSGRNPLPTTGPGCLRLAVLCSYPQKLSLRLSKLLVG
jgi:hypothetical protein